jgi:hypothetical protein
MIAGEATLVRREECENTTRRGSKGERKRREEIPAKTSAEEDYYWQGMVAPDPAFYLKDNV